MTLSLKHEGLKVIIGGNELKGDPFVPYDETVCKFLIELSSALNAAPDAKIYPDIATFAFWCRKGNIARLRKVFEDGHTRLGRGMTFHITPSNVAITFVYSFAFGLLAGNCNVVRIPSNPFPQIDIVCRVIHDLLRTNKFKQIYSSNAFVSYNRDDKITAYFSAHCDARVIWGGDKTIKRIRQFPIPIHGIEIGFADRYSFCIIDAIAVSILNEQELSKLARKFYNDAYLMDQNACSSPHLIVWLSGDSVSVRARFWKAVGKIVSAEYGLETVFTLDKYNDLLEAAVDNIGIRYFEREDNHVYRIGLNHLDPGIENLRGRFGTFYEYDTSDLVDLSKIITAKFQTLTYFGVEPKKLLDFITKNQLGGVDRVVPVGQALDMNVIWDGMDVCKSLSRIIDLR